MTRLAILAGAVLAAALVAVTAIRRRVPTYPTWAAYVAADDEGDALPPDPYLDGLR